MPKPKHCTRTVSYTHLDVYKRQALVRHSVYISTLSNLIHYCQTALIYFAEHPKSSVSRTAGSLAVVTTPVFILSYSVDVYKRQPVESLMGTKPKKCSFMDASAFSFT